MDVVKGDKIKYITVELVLKPDKLTKEDGLDDIIEFGLFKGMRAVEIETAEDSKPQEFVLVVPPAEKCSDILTNDKYVKAFARDVYNVMSLEVFDGSVRHICFFKAEDADQEEADKIIATLLEKMKEADKTEKDGQIIKIKDYSELPDSFEDPLKKKTSQFNSRSTGNSWGHGGGATNWNSTYNRTNTTTTSTTRTRNPFFFRRKTDKPHHATLKKLSKLLDNMATGDYIEPDWPRIPKAEPPPKEESASGESKSAGGAYPMPEDEEIPWQGIG